jgi:CRISPR/Cas system-associated protein Cas7 (RAMP superfamily)
MKQLLAIAIACCSSIAFGQSIDRNKAYDQMIKYGYDLANKERVDTDNSMLEALKKELEMVSAAEPGKFRYFKTARDKNVRKIELQLRIDRIEGIKPGKNAKWVFPTPPNTGRSTSIEVGNLYTISSAEVADTVSETEFHVLVPIIEDRRISIQRVKLKTDRPITSDAYCVRSEDHPSDTSCTAAQSPANTEA